MMLASGWSANQFSALLGAYRSETGLSASAVTGLFAVYVVGLIPGLLAGGPLADRHGRRPVALTALAVNVLASAVLMVGAGAPWLLLPGRFLTGAGAGALLAAGSAWVKELSAPPYAEEAGPGTAARRSGLFVSAGFASGGLVAALIAQWAPEPMVLAYVPHLLLGGAAWAAAFRAPETGVREHAPRPVGENPAEAPVDWRRFRRAVLPLAPWVFAAPTVGFATLPGLTEGRLAGWETVYAGVATLVVPGCGLLVQPLARRLAATGTVGLLVMAAGFALAAPAAASGRPDLALVAAAVLGTGYGLVLTHCLTETAASAPPAHLALVSSLFWTAAYVGMFAPFVITLLSGVTAPWTLLASAAVLVLATNALFLRLRGRG